MGATYTLYKIDRGETFELGKKFNSFLPEGEVFLLKNLYPETSQLLRKLYEETTLGWYFSTDKEHTLYVHKLQDMLYDWCDYDRILMLNDSRIDELDDLEFWHLKYNFMFTDYSKFKQTGTRYTGETENA